MSADPLAGDPDTIRRLGRLHTKHANAVRTGARHVIRASEAASSGWTGLAQQRFMALAATVPAGSQRVAERLDAAATALDSYARDVAQIKDDAQRVRIAQRHAADDIAANARAIDGATTTARADDATEVDRKRLQQLQSGAAGLASLQGRLTVQWDSAVAARAAADQRAAAALQATEVVGKLRSAGAVAAMSDGQFLTWLGTLDRESIAALAEDAAVAARLAGMPPEDVAAWWSAMSGPEGSHSAEQDAFVAALPAVIGNLNGVAYWARAKANTTVLADRLAEAEKQAADALDRLGAAKGQAAISAARATFDLWERQRDAYRNIRDALDSGAVALVALLDDRPPLAQIVSGDLETAAHVTYIVPGMNTATHQDGTVASYADIARGMRFDQHRAARVPPERIAVVAWIGYHPPMADGPSAVSVLTNGRAHAGADALVRDLDGFHAARAASGLAADLSVVGHSYGTNVATIALTRTHADHVVLLGSAGVTDVAPTAAALDVPEGEVFASQGAKDGWAVTGQNLSGRRDPTDPSWGAHVFSSETRTDDSGTLHGITQHGPYDGTDGDDVYSYFDENTTSRHDTARATMGLGGEVPIGGRPTDRLEQNMADNPFLHLWQAD